MKYILCILFLIQFKNCKSETQTVVNVIEKTDISSKKEVEISDIYVINSIDKIYIGNKIIEKDKVDFLIKTLSKSFEREIEKPYMWDIFTSSNDELLQFYHYKDFNINKFLYKSYFIKIDYEDARYEAILLINDSEDNIYNNMIVYENLASEENYQRTTKIEEDKLEIQFKKDQLLKKMSFIVKNGLFLDYFQEQNVEKKWGNKEKRDSDTIYEYELKGQTINHLKNGYWIEKKYSTEYGKTIIEDGNYINGVKSGEWNYSPDGPVDKIEVFKNGSITKTLYP